MSSGLVSLVAGTHPSCLADMLRREMSPRRNTTLATDQGLLNRNQVPPPIHRGWDWLRLLLLLFLHLNILLLYFLHRSRHVGTVRPTGFRIVDHLKRILFRAWRSSPTPTEASFMDRNGVRLNCQSTLKFLDPSKPLPVLLFQRKKSLLVVNL